MKEYKDCLDSIVLESIPVSNNNSVYDKRISWIHKKTLIPIRVDFFQNGEKEPVKRSMVKKMEKKQGYWTIMKAITRDLKSLHETHLQVNEILYDQKSILPELITQKYLEDPQREKEIINQISGM